MGHDGVRSRHRLLCAFVKGWGRASPGVFPTTSPTSTVALPREQASHSHQMARTGQENRLIMCQAGPGPVSLLSSDGR